MTMENAHPLSGQDGNTSLSAPKAPDLDLSKYQDDLREFDMDNAQARELLETLWSVMRSFVELGFTGDICGLIFEDSLPHEEPAPENAILPPSQTAETPSKGKRKDRQPC